MLRKLLIATALLFVPSLVMAQVKADHYPRELVLEDCSNTASGTTVAADGCNVITFTGVTQIDTINTCNAAKKGRELSIICSDLVPFGDGAGNLLLNGAFTCAADGTLSLICGGTNWAEVSRGVTAGGGGDDITAQAAFANPVDPIFNDTSTIAVDTVDTTVDEITWTFLPAGVDGPTWGDGTTSTWIFNVGATDPTLAFDTDLLTITNMATLTASATDADFDALTATTVTVDASDTGALTLTTATLGAQVSIGITEAAGPEAIMDINVDTGTGTLTQFIEIDGVGNDIELGTPGTNYVDITTAGVMTFVGTGDIDLPNNSVDVTDIADAELTLIADLAETTGNVMIGVAGAWASVAQPIIDCTNCTAIPSGSTHTGTVTWSTSPILESGTTLQFGDGSDATVTHTYGVTTTDPVVAYSSAVINWTTGELQQGGSAVLLDSDLGGSVQDQDADLDTIAGLTATSGNVMFAVGSAWASDATPAINCTDCTSIPAGALTAISAPVGDTSFTLEDGEEIAFVMSSTGVANTYTLNFDQPDDGDATDTIDVLSIDVTSESGDTGDLLTALAINYEEGTANTILDSAIKINNAETTAATMIDAIIITSSGVNDGVTDAIDVSASNIKNAINIGANDFITAASTITSVELDRLDALAGVIVTDTTAVIEVDGRSLTIDSGTLDADAELYTDTKCVLIETPVDADDLMIYRFDAGAVMTSIDCIVEDATSAVVVIVECDSAGANCGTSRFTESVTCDVDGATDDGLTETGIVATAWIRAQVGTVTGTPGHLNVCFTFEAAD